MNKKWQFWKKVVKTEVAVKPTDNVCVHCGKHVLRQSTLSEYADVTPVAQQKLPLEMTESVGFGSTPRRYRGRI